MYESLDALNFIESPQKFDNAQAVAVKFLPGSTTDYVHAAIINRGGQTSIIFRLVREGHEPVELERLESSDSAEWLKANGANGDVDGLGKYGVMAMDIAGPNIVLSYVLRIDTRTNVPHTYPMWNILAGYV